VRKTIQPALWLLFFLPVSMLSQKAAVKKPLPIVFDDWWNVDYVKNSCEMWEKSAHRVLGSTCASEFEDEVEVAFASESACHGLVLLHLTPEMVHEGLKNPSAPATGAMLEVSTEHWQLMLDLDGLSTKQVGRGWTLSPPAGTPLNGRITTPARLAQQICKIAKGVGGTAK
jgi:hypothetical protein